MAEEKVTGATKAEDRSAFTASVVAEDARTGAQSVAEAVKRVADAAVAEVQKVPKRGASYDFTATATGSKLVLEGPAGSFGPSGTVTMNGVQARTREWSTHRIVGELPTGARSGEVLVHVDDKTTRRGYVTIV